jgi:hypothetical protein
MTDFICDSIDGCVGRAVLLAALILILEIELTTKINTKIKVKGSGQECPLHTIYESACEKLAEMRQ